MQGRRVFFGRYEATGTATGKALHYLRSEWSKLNAYLEDSRLEIDNNLAENAIRPFVMGRKNWLFSDSVAGVKSSASLYSLIETAKANGLEPYAYLRRVYTELPKARRRAHNLTEFPIFLRRHFKTLESRPSLENFDFSTKVAKAFFQLSIFDLGICPDNHAV